jgi:hypothetical protein
VERIGVKTRRISNLYVLLVRAPGRGRALLARGESRTPWAPFAAGDVLTLDDRRLRVTSVETRVEQRRNVIEHVTEVLTRTIRRRRAPAKNVVPMPMGDDSVVAQFIRYHVFVRVFGGDADAWLAHVRERGGDEGDLRFVHWIRSRLRKDPLLLASIRRMVDATPFWRVAEA